VSVKVPADNFNNLKNGGCMARCKSKMHFATAWNAFL